MIAWTAEALLGSGLLMALVLAVRGVVRRYVGAQIGYALWALPAARLLLPPLPAAWPAPAGLPLARVSDRAVVMLVDGPVVDSVAATVVDWPMLLATGWAIGAAVVVGWHLAAHRRFCTGLMRDVHTIGEVGGIPVITSPATTGPLAIGVLRRRIAVPLDWTERFTAAERSLALAHEREHHRRGDLLANGIALALLALHWFDPIAWAAFRAFRADQELATDAAVLATRLPRARADYAAAIAKAAAGPGCLATCHLGSFTDLKRRLEMLSMSRPSRRRAATGGLSLLGLSALALGATASGARPATLMRAGVDQALAQAASAPVPPAPPVPTPSVTTIAPIVASAHASEQAPTRQARTIVVRPTRGGHANLIIHDGPITPGAPIPPLAALPSDFAVPDTCTADGRRPPQAFVVKGQGDHPYTVICTRPASFKPGASLDERGAYQQALAGLHTARVQIEQQTDFPADERAKALAAIDQSAAEIEGDLARLH